MGAGFSIRGKTGTWSLNLRYRSANRHVQDAERIGGTLPTLVVQ